MSVLGNVTTMSLKNHNRQFLRSEGKGQHKRNLNQTRIYKPMPSLVNQPLLFAFCAAGLFYTSQGLGFVSVFLMKLSFQTERKGKETKQVQIYTVVAQTQSCTTGSILPALQGAVVQSGHSASVDPPSSVHPYRAPAERGMGSVALLSSEIKDGGPDEQGHKGWYLLLATICLQEAVSTYRDLLP